MNSPSMALVWELWRKNRAGFIVLAALFLVCFGARVMVGRLERRAAVLEAHDPNVSVLKPETFLLASPTGAIPSQVTLKLQGKTIFDDFVVPKDRFVVTALFHDTGAGVLQIVLTNPDRQTAAAFVPQADRDEKDPKAGAAPGRETAAANTRFLADGWSYSGPLPFNPTLVWTTADNRSGAIRLEVDPEYPVTLALAQAHAEHWRSYALFWSMGLFTFCVFSVFAIFGVAEPAANRGFTGIPPRGFTLPVRTGLLVAWPLGLGCALIAVMYLAWSRFIFQPLTLGRGPMPDLYMTLLLVAALVSLQALIWSLPSFPKLRASLLTLLVLALASFAALPFEDRVNRASEPVLMAGFALVTGGASFIAWLGVVLERRGFWTSWGASRSALDSFHLALPRTLQFAGPLHAQLWVEWRRNGRLPAAVFLILFTVLSALVLALPWTPNRIQTVAGAFIPVLCILVGGWLGVAGLNLARDGASRTLALSSFSAVRPASVGVILEAKLVVGAIVWIAFALGLTGTWVVASFVDASAPALRGLVLLLVLSTHLFAGILPLCLTGRIAGVPWSLLPWLVVYGAVVNAAFWFANHPAYQWTLWWIFAGALFLKLALAAQGFGRALRNGLISRVFVFVYSAGWLSVTWLVLRMAAEFAERTAAAEVLVPGAALLIPLVRVAWSPLALAMNRAR